MKGKKETRVRPKDFPFSRIRTWLKCSQRQLVGPFQSVNKRNQNKNNLRECCSFKKIKKVCVTIDLLGPASVS